MQPQNRKFRKDRKGTSSFRGIQYRGNTLSFAPYGLKSMDNHLLKATQIEAVRKVIIRKIRKIGKIWIRTFPDKPISQKPTKTRMGKGKGSVQYWVSTVKAGQIIIEIGGAFTESTAKKVLQVASQKLPIRTKFISFSTAMHS